MTDSGFSQVPPGPRALDPSIAQARSGQTVKIEAVRGELRDVNRATRIEGEVIQVTPDGQATIRTDQGDEIDIRLRGRVMLQEGQQVEIDLPPGHPPRQAAIRPMADVPPPVQTPATVTSSNPAPVSVSPPPAIQSSVIATPAVPPEIRAILDENAAPAVRPSPLPAPVGATTAPLLPDAIIRLVPLPALPVATDLASPPVPIPAAVPDTAIQLSAFQAVRIDSPVPGSMQADAVKSAFPGPVFPSPLSPGLQQHSGLPPSAQALPATGALVLTPDPLPSKAVPASPLFPVPQANPAEPAAGLRMSIPGQPILQPLAGIRPEPLDLPAFSAQPVMAQAGPVPVTESFNTRIASIQPGGIVKIISLDGTPEKSSPSFLPAPESSPLTMTADVVATTRKNLPVLSVFMPGQDDPHLFLLHFPASNLPVGSRLQILPTLDLPATNSHAAPALPPNPTPAPAFDLFSGWTWPAFDDAAQILAQDAAIHGSAAQGMTNILPNPGNPAQMPPALLFFLAAARSGDVAGWMGEKTLDVLRKDGARRGGDILSRMARDMAGLSKTLAEPVSQDWRGMAIPLYWQNEIQKMHLFYRHQNGGHDDDPVHPANRSTRFIFDLHLDRIGDVQLDGLMKDKRLDLILRTRTMFSRSMQAAMRQRYLDVLESGNLTGDMAFQNRADQWVRVEIKPPGLETTA